MGLVLCYKMGLRLYYKHFVRLQPHTTSVSVTPPTVPPSKPPDLPADPGPSPEESAQPVVIVTTGPTPEIDEITKISPTQPEKAFEIAFRHLAGDNDIMLMAKTLDRLESRLETYDRNKVYVTVENILKQKSEVSQELAGLFIDSLVRTQAYFHEKHDPSQAEANLQKLVLEQDPNFSPLALHWLASWRIMEDTQQAIRLFERQIHEYPECPLNGQAAFLMGTCYRILEDDDKALEQCQMVLRTYADSMDRSGDPLEPYIRHALADIYIHIGQKDDAKKELDYIKSFWGGYRYEKDVDELLKSLS